MSTTAEQDTAPADDLLAAGRWTGKIYSDGWVDGAATIDSIEPATGETLATTGVGDAGTVARAAASAAAAQREWAQTPITERVAIVRRAAEALERHRAEIVKWIVRESGSIPPKADVEITASIGQLDMACALVSHPLGLVLPSLTPGRTSTARRVPIGVVGVITPWNFPLVLAMRSVGPALVLGNADRHEVRPQHAGQRRRADRAAVRGGRATRGSAARVRRRRRRRPGARRGPQRSDDLVHGLDRGRPRGRRDGRSHAQAHGARARGQQPTDRARGRRHQRRVVGRRVGLVPALGADLHRLEPASGPRVDRRGVPRGARPAGGPSAGRQPEPRRGRAGADHQRQAGPAGSRRSSTTRSARARRR